MSANTLLTSVLTGGVSSHATTAEEANALATDFVSNGVVGAITLNSGSGGTGSFCVNADGTPDMGVTIKSGQAYITATPSGQNSQVLRVRAAADYTAYTINANASGSTKYDWIYLSISATNANAPSSDGSNVASFVTSRSSSNSSDNGTPPTYGLLLAIVTVANGASSITNSNITDKRFNASNGAQNGSLVVQQNGTGTDAKVQAAGIDANVNLDLRTKGTGVVEVNGTQIGAGAFKNPYKFRVYATGVINTAGGSYTRVLFDTREFDTGSNVDISSTKGRFTAPIAGFYAFAASAGGNISGTTQFAVALYKNGALHTPGSSISTTAATTTATSYVTVADTIQLAANDTIDVMVFLNGTIGLANGANGTFFSGFLLSSL